MIDARRYLPGKGGLRAAQKAATRQLFKEAARAEFVRSGYGATRVEDVAAAAGASPATFYLHFPAKRDVVLELVGDVRTDGIEHYLRLETVGEQGSIKEITNWLTASMARWEELMPIVRVIEEAAASDEVVRKAHYDFLSVGVEALVRGLERWGGTKDGSAHARAMLVMSLHQGYFLEVLRSGFKIDAARDIPILARMWRSALRPSPAPSPTRAGR